MKTTLAKAYPNAHGWLKLIRYIDTAYETGAEYETIWVVVEPHDERDDDGAEFDAEAEARTFYDERLAFWLKEPNWEAQARYDDAHGTDSGYAPWQRVEY